MLFQPREMFLILVSLISILNGVCSQSCASQDTCSDCLTLNGCGWCITESSGYCRPTESLGTMDCPMVINPSSKINSIDSRILDQLNQISVGSLDVSLRVGEPLTVNFTVKAADNFPLDLYILMDLSNTYQDDLIVVKNLSFSLANSLSDLSSNSLIGFGTFVDKQSPPFASRRQLDLLFEDLSGNPSCRRDEKCSFPVAYEHVSDLTNSSETFNETIQQVVISTSASGPEGTLDAMMQSAVCTDLVGWRDTSRKVLMVMTDDEVHMAGDGRMGGITRRNDAECRTEFNEQYNAYLYSTSAEQDYPSFEQLRLVLRSQGIVPIFAIPMGANRFEAIEKHFSIVKDLLNGYIAISNTRSTNLIEVIAEAYNDVVSQVSLDFDTPSFLQTSVQLACPTNSTNTAYSSERCTDIGRDEVQVNLTLTLKECTSEAENGYPLEVIIPGFDKFTINVKGLCSCGCDQVSMVNTTNCINGELTCGKCYCNEGWKGDRCDCSLMACPSFSGQECGGRGTCDGCGNCDCNEINSPRNGVDDPVIFGDACECSNYECEVDSDGNVCSGRGQCTCENGEHSCNCIASSITGEIPSGDICQCTSDYCIDPRNTSSGICYGNGRCASICEGEGKGCECSEGCSGDYCDRCVDLSVDNCPNADDDCVKCYGEAAKDGNDPAQSCDASCIGYITLSKEQSSGYNIPGINNTQSCSTSTAECSFVYYVGVNITTQDLVFAVEPRDCLLLPIWAISVIIVVGLLIIGVIVIVVIKLCLLWLDHREYKRFLYDVSSANKTLQSNPVYQDPITHVDNPVHGKAI